MYKCFFGEGGGVKCGTRKLTFKKNYTELGGGRLSTGGLYPRGTVKISL